MQPNQFPGRWIAIAAQPAVQQVCAIWIVAAFSCVLFFYRLGDRALWSSHEARAGQHAQRMLDTGRWGIPTLYSGVVDYQKPPLYYWLVASVAWLRGGVVDEWSVRFPAGLSALCTVALVYAFASAVWGSTSGMLAALVLAANLRFGWLARVGRIDMPLTCAITTVLLSFWMAYRRSAGFDPEKRLGRGWGWMALSYGAAGVAVLLKGPVGLVLPAFAIVLFLAWEGHAVWPWRRGWITLLDHLGVWWGLLVFLAIAAPWFAWAGVETRGEFFNIFIGHHHWNRTLGADGLKPEPVWYYLPRLVIDLFPWSFFLPAAIVAGIRSRASRDRSLDRFAIAWVASMFAVLSIVRFKRADYLLPIVPGVALLLAGHWSRVADLVVPRSRSIGRPILCLTLTIAVVIALVAFIVVNGSRRAGGIAELAPIRAMLHETDRMILVAVADALSTSPAALALVGLGIGSGVLATYLLLVWRRRVSAVMIYAVAWAAAMVVMTGSVLPALEPLREQRSIARMVRAMQPRGTELCYYGREDQQVMFYLGPGAKWLSSRDQFRPTMTRSEPALVLVEADRFAQRQRDWQEVRMVPLYRNTENRFGAHRDPVVLVANEAASEYVRFDARATVPAAN